MRFPNAVRPGKRLPYYMGVFSHAGMKVEFWKDLERDLWIEAE